MLIGTELFPLGTGQYRFRSLMYPFVSPAFTNFVLIISGSTTLVPSSGQMQQHPADSNTAAGQRATNAQPAGANLNTVRTVPNNLHNLGAMPAQTSPADPNVVVTTHHTFAGNQVRV